jgi:hypothetical protein
MRPVFLEFYLILRIFIKSGTHILPPEQRWEKFLKVNNLNDMPQGIMRGVAVLYAQFILFNSNNEVNVFRSKTHI